MTLTANQKRGAAIVLCTAAVGLGLYFKWPVTSPSIAGAQASTITQPTASSGSRGTKVVAVVNGSEIFESEIANAVSQGADRAVAVDRYINKVLIANLAQNVYEKDAKEALKGAEREILAQLYVNKKVVEMRAALTPEQIKTFYDANIKAEEFATYRVKYMVTADEKESNEVVAAIAAGKAKEVEAKFKYFKEGADNFIAAAELPYNTGTVIRGLKKGEYSRPVVLRNGFFVFFLEDIKTNPKPELTKMTEDIKTFLVNKQLGDELASARTAAKIELR
jgi:hypothetical protein